MAATITVGSSGNSMIDGLLSETKWATVGLSYSFRGDATDTAGPSDGSDRLVRVEVLQFNDTAVMLGDWLL